jgi:hypothetical protein
MHFNVVADLRLLVQCTIFFTGAVGGRCMCLVRILFIGTFILLW